MGYNAYVNCNCFRNGKTSDPPFKENIGVDEEGIYLNLEDLYDKDKDEYFKRHLVFDNWKRSACQHVDMELVNTRLSNISGMAQFKYVLHQFGGEKDFLL